MHKKDPSEQSTTIQRWPRARKASGCTRKDREHAPPTGGELGLPRRPRKHSQHCQKEPTQHHLWGGR
eukprot:8292309-Pyramimonas_sp.AAC.1